MSSRIPFRIQPMLATLVKEPFQVYVKAATCPILLLAAEHGDTIRDSELEVLKAINPRLRAEKVRGVGHMIYKDAPQKTADYIVRFVAAHLRRAPLPV